MRGAVTILPLHDQTDPPGSNCVGDVVYDSANRLTFRCSGVWLDSAILLFVFGFGHFVHPWASTTVYVQYRSLTVPSVSPNGEDITTIQNDRFWQPRPN